MHYGLIRKNDIADGPGVRVSIFVSGCRNHCKGCFQPETWDFDYGEIYTEDTEKAIIEALSKPYIEGLTLLGGDPMEPENQPWLLGLLQKIKADMPEKNIWCYSGYTLEKLIDKKKPCHTDITVKLLKLIDVLVDGKFEEDKKDLALKYRGSSNQRVIDLKKTFNQKKIIKAME